MAHVGLALLSMAITHRNSKRTVNICKVKKIRKAALAQRLREVDPACRVQSGSPRH